MRILKYFLITEPTVTIEANDGRIHAHQGSDVEFRCLIRGMLQKPAYVFWYVDVSYGKVVFGFTHPSFISVPTFPYFPHSESFSTIEIDIFSRKNVHFHTFSTPPPFHQGGLKALQQCNHPFSSINLLRYYISDTDPNSIAEHVQKNVR